jgi:adenosylcobyric acid synthase
MVQGTASSVGKSLVVTGLCRVLRQDGLRVAPFKAQNMALNAYVTPDGGEIGRAQAVQAEAAGLPPSVEMNPILLKPEDDARSQVVVLGQSIGSMTARQYHEKKRELRDVVAESLALLRQAHDVVVIEGAGSPAEINLREGDIVNMYVARIAEAPVLLVGDIDRGGVFAALVGTLELLEPDERARVAGFLINKFRGDLGLLRPGLDFLERKTGVPVLGVLPHLPRLRIADEDSVSLEARRSRRKARAEELAIAVVCLPRIANSDDFEPLEHESGVHVRFVDRPEDVVEADLAILPGSKSTIADLAWLRETGIAASLIERAGRGDPVLGICGGCQMLTERIDDAERVESIGPTAVAGLGLLEASTRFMPKKTTARVVARPLRRGFFAGHLADSVRVEAYEIHMGLLEASRADSAPFEIIERTGRREATRDGAVGFRGAVVGTMLHGLFENDDFRQAVLRSLRARRGQITPQPSPTIPTKSAEYDRLARALRESVDLARLRVIAGL